MDRILPSPLTAMRWLVTFEAPRQRGRSPQGASRKLSRFWGMTVACVLDRKHE
jgi:hypothetical protein